MIIAYIYVDECRKSRVYDESLIYSTYLPRVAIGGNSCIRKPFFIFRGVAVPGKLKSSQYLLSLRSPQVRVRNDTFQSYTEGHSPFLQEQSIISLIF